MPRERDPWKPLAFMDEFIEQLRAEGKSKDYIRCMENALNKFAAFLRGEGVEHPEEISRMHLVRYQGNVNGDPNLAPLTRIQRMKYLRTWLNWCEEIGHIDNNPWIRIKLADIPKQPKPLTDEEVDLLFEAHRRSAFSVSPFAFHRSEAILTLLYAWGLRIHELCGLNLANVDAQLDFVQTKNKGGGTKNLPYSPEIKRIMQRYLAVRGKHAKPGEDALFISTTGERLGTADVRRIVTDLGKMAGLSINPHRLRDTCGTHLLDSDVPVERVQRILGHKRLQQTLSYARVNDKKVAESHIEAMDPRLSRLFQKTKDLTKDEQKPAP